MSAEPKIAEKPLYVQVAEALGREACGRWMLIASGLAGPVYEKCCSHEDCYPERMPPRYDTDFSATGPLIEKYEIWLRCDKGMWAARTDIWPDEEAGKYTTPLLAICHLILTLKEAGRL